jgi:hypothetical protein
MREACQTGVDDTSIDALEDVANHLGLVTKQVDRPTMCSFPKPEPCPRCW